jgi:hypothetical protein
VGNEKFINYILQANKKTHHDCIVKPPIGGGILGSLGGVGVVKEEESPSFDGFEYGEK